jgi:hypothetical protein
VSLAISLVAVLAVGAVKAHAIAATNECNGIKQCQRAQGPWVVVPPDGTAVYLLDCPLRRGIVGGTDALASSSDIHVSFDAQLGAPVAPGRTTTRYAFFRALSATHRPGSFQPRVGCIPVSPNSSSTTSAQLQPGSPLLIAARTTQSAQAVPGPPLALAATTMKVRPGLSRTATIACVAGQELVDSWTAVGFRTVRPPRVEFADAIRVSRTTVGRKVTVSIEVSEALPAGSGAEVQLGVACSQP